MAGNAISLIIAKKKGQVFKP